jgi:hypothetical protein
VWHGNAATIARHPAADLDVLVVRAAFVAVLYVNSKS